MTREKSTRGAGEASVVEADLRLLVFPELPNHYPEYIELPFRAGDGISLAADEPALHRSVHK